MELTRFYRCLLIPAMAGIVACGERPAGPDLTLPARIDVMPDSLRLLVDDTTRIQVAVLNVQGDTIADAPVAFLSADTTIATIDSAGLVRGRASGVSDLTVASDSITATVRVHVRVNGTLVVSPHDSLIQATDTLQLAAVVRDSAGAVVGNAIVQYRSLDPTIVGVSPGGLVTFGGVAGTGLITANSHGRADTAFVTAVVARFPLGGNRVTGNAAGDVLVWRDVGGPGQLWMFRPPQIPPVDQLTTHATAVITDIMLNTNATRAYAADAYFGNIVGMDVPGDSDLFVEPVGFPQYQPWGPTAVAIDPGDTVVYYAANGFVNRLHLVTMDTSQLFQHGTVYHMLLHDPWLYVAGSGDVQRYNFRTGTLTQYSNTRFTLDVALSPDGTRLYELRAGYPTELRVHVRDVATGDTLPPLELPGFPAGSYVAVQPTTGLVWVSVGDSGRVFIFDPITRAPVRTLRTGGSPAQLFFTTSGLGMLGNEDGWVDYVK